MSASPDCPRCGHPPLDLIVRRPLFCSNDDCQVLSWDPDLTPAQLQQADWGEVDLSALAPE